MTTPSGFLRETVDELKKVTWPKSEEVIRLSLVVIGISLFIGFYIGALDFIFTKITEAVIK